MRGFAEAPLRQTKIPFHLRVLASLNFFATGTYQTGIGQDLNLAMSQPSICRSVTEVGEIFCNHLLRRYVKFLVNEVEVTLIIIIVYYILMFEDNLNFPNSIGAIDCIHVAMISPNVNDVNPPVAYLTRKGYFSINVQGI